MMTKTKRLEMCKLIYGVFDRLDKTGKNTQMYKNKLEKMSDKEFDDFFKKFFKDEEANFFLDSEPYENDFTPEDVEKAADFLKVPLYEYLIMPYENPDGDPVASVEPVPVFYIHTKRLQQLLSKKNTMSIHTDKRDPQFGQVTRDDKNGRSSDMENIALIALNCNDTLKEMVGPRSDDLKAKEEMFKKIRNDAYVSLESLPSRKTDKVSLNTLDVQFISCGLKTNLITDTLALPRTLQNQNRDVTSISGKYYQK